MVLGDSAPTSSSSKCLGSATRPAFGPPFAGDAGPTFVGFNRNKRSVTLDLHTSEGRDTCLALAGKCERVRREFPPRHE